MKVTMNNLSIGNINFGVHYINADIGASSNEGSLKLRLLDEQGQTINVDKNTVFKEGDKRNEDLFEKRLAQQIIDFKNRNMVEILKHDPQDETKVTICYPGPVTDKGVKLTNFAYDDARTKKFERHINPDVINSNLLITKAINLVSAKHVNDMAAAGSSLLAKIQDMDKHDELPENVLEEGKEILYLYPGGGLGSGVIMIDKDENNNRVYKIKPTEKQHALNSNYSEAKILEKDTCSSGLIENFVDAVADYDSIAKSKVPYIYKNDDMKNETYKDLKEKFATNTMLIDYPINQEAYKQAEITNIDDSVLKKANYKAMNKAMESLAQIVAHQVCEKNTNTVVLAGNIGNAIKKSVNNNDLFKTGKYENIDDDKRFDEILKDKVRDNLLEIGNSLMGKNEDFNILTIPLQDNTEGEHLLHNGWQVGQKSPAWYSVRDTQQKEGQKLKLNI